MSDTRRVREIVGEQSTLPDAVCCLVGITEHPQRDATLPQATYRRIMAAVEERVGAVYFAIVNLQSPTHVLLRAGEITDIH